MVKMYERTNKVICIEAAEYLIKKLKHLGFTILRYNSYSSNSIYLKLDEGVTGTIRISDHRGKKHLKYRYNLILKHEQRLETRGGYDMYYFPMQSIDLLIQKAVYDRQQRIEKYGILNYNKYREQNRQEGKSKRGFWQQAEYV